MVLVSLAAVGCTSRIYDVKTDKSLFLDARPGEKIYLKVTNTSLLKDFPLDRDIRAKLTQEGYTLVDTPEAADYVVRANVEYSGLMEPAVKGEKAGVGAAAGGVLGGLGGYAGGGSKTGAAGGAIAGILIGAGLGYWLEREDMKNTFLTTVKLKIDDRTENKTHLVHVNARIREEDLTMESAADKVRDDIAFQIAGHF
jgi:outer membrane lipoprotein SlyB